jgi:hypothetical protein
MLNPADACTRGCNFYVPLSYSLANNDESALSTSIEEGLCSLSGEEVKVFGDAQPVRNDQHITYINRVR